MSAHVSMLTNHVRVVLVLDGDPAIRQRDVAAQLGITEGAVQRILHELTESGHVRTVRVGRRNHYEINHSAQLRHPAASHTSLGALLTVFGGRDSSTSREAGGS